MINKDMTIQEVLSKKPEAAEIMQDFGMHCLGCMIASSESLEEGAKAHGIDPEKLLTEINKR
ncbi:MAG: DUF1858 domain-containing protein [Candidatus Woesearchaeota archaeon]